MRIAFMCGNFFRLLNKASMLLPVSVEAIKSDVLASSSSFLVETVHKVIIISKRCSRKFVALWATRKP